MTSFGSPTVLLEKVQISSALDVLQTPTEFSKATANIEPSFEKLEARGVRLRRERAVRQCHADAAYDHSLMDASREVVRRMGCAEEGENDSEVNGSV